jgi:hypothetical protein
MRKYASTRKDEGVKRRQVGVWQAVAVCPSGHHVEISCTLPHYGDAPALYQCSHCADLVVIDPDAVYYVGPAWDSLHADATCQRARMHSLTAGGTPITSAAPGAVQLAPSTFPPRIHRKVSAPNRLPGTPTRHVEAITTLTQYRPPGATVHPESALRPSYEADLGWRLPQRGRPAARRQPATPLQLPGAF